MSGERSGGGLELLSRLTPARVGLGRAGASMPMEEVLRFGLAHARARDAVRAPFDPAEVAAALRPLSLDAIDVESAAQGRAEYLRRPDLGRRLSSASAARLAAAAGDFDVAIIVGDGLSAAAAQHHAPPLLALLAPRLRGKQLRLGPVAIASQARVALGDEVCGLLQARCALVLIGERPGLSSPDSLGAYLTFAPGPGVTDADRNCVSNIRPGGLPFDEAAHRIVWLLDAALARGLTGVALKDESEAALGAPAPQAALKPPAFPA